MADLKHITSPSIGTAPAKACVPTYDDVQLDVGHLFHLIQVTLERLEDLPFLREDGSPNGDLQEIHALLWIARDTAGKIKSDFAVAQHTDAAA
jgi:hypothetical protein